MYPVPLREEGLGCSRSELQIRKSSTLSTPHKIANRKPKVARVAHSTNIPHEYVVLSFVDFFMMVCWRGFAFEKKVWGLWQRHIY
jgi:hypothetical protein